jgi:hypothetical protein
MEGQRPRRTSTLSYIDRLFASSTFAQPPNNFPAYPPAAPQLQPRTPIRSVPVLGVRPGVTPRPFPGVATPGLLPQRVAAGSTPLPPPATSRLYPTSAHPQISNINISDHQCQHRWESHQRQRRQHRSYQYRRGGPSRAHPNPRWLMCEP